MIDAGEAGAAFTQRLRNLVDHVLLDQIESALALEVAQVLRAAGKEAVQADDARALLDQPVADVRPDEPGTAGDQRDRFRLTLHKIFPAGLARPICSAWFA